MARQQLPPQIKKKVVSTEGRDVIRYEVVVDIGDPRSGKRRQTRRRFKTEAEARAFLAPILGDKAKGLHVAPTELTVAQAVERWLAAQRVERKTREAYTNHLRPMVEAYGDHPIQTITKDDIERLVSALIQGTTPRGVWSASTINPFLSRLRSVMDDLVGQGVLPSAVFSPCSTALVARVSTAFPCCRQRPARSMATDCLSQDSGIGC